MKNMLRTLLKIREVRIPEPPGPKPPVGSNIVRDRLRMRLKFPIDDDQWYFFTRMGWRTVDMRTNRRRYTCVSDKILIKLLKADELEREVLHARLIAHSEERIATKLAQRTSLVQRFLTRP